MANVQWKSTNTNQWQRCRWRAPVWMENVKWREKRTHSHTNLCAGNGIPYRYTFNSPRYPPVFIRRYKLIRKVIECRNMNAGKMKNREKERERKWRKKMRKYSRAHIPVNGLWRHQDCLKCSSIQCTSYKYTHCGYHVFWLLLWAMASTAATLYL